MRLTRRGWAAAAVGVGAELMAFAFGARALDAVAGPAFVALAVGAVVLARRAAPELTRRQPQPGFPGERRRIRLAVTADGPCRVRDELPGNVRAVDAPAATPVGTGEASYEVVLGSRGEGRLGPATVVQRDPLGVVARERTVGGTTPVLVYPDVVPVAPTRALSGLVERSGSPERQAFDHLREYVPGDALRDVDWKSSAKRPDDQLVVTEFAEQTEAGITVVAEATTGHGDEMARAAASIAVHLLDADVAVGLIAPTVELTQGRGDEHRDELLALLARAPAGRAGDREADVHVAADADGVQVTVADATLPFAELRGDAPDRAGRAADTLGPAGAGGGEVGA